MFEKFVLGWVGSILVFIGIVLAIIGIFGDKGYLVLGILLSFGGGFLRYLSTQAVTVERTVKEDRLETNQYKFNGEKKLDNETYQLYLVEKYNIKKNDTLEKYVLNNKPYADLQEALKVAHNLEIDNLKVSETTTISIPDGINDNDKELYIREQLLNSEKFANKSISEIDAAVQEELEKHKNPN